MNRFVKAILLWCLLALLSVSAIGCNTMRGAGEDVENAGEAVQRVAE
jgi:predicted small secreted protein